jgi:dCMP deaminase
VGISEVFYNQGYNIDGETADVFKQAGVRLRMLAPVCIPQVAIKFLLT